MTSNNEIHLAGRICRCVKPCANCCCKDTTDPLKNQDYLARVRTAINKHADRCRINTTQQPEDYRQRVSAALQRFTDRQTGRNQACTPQTRSKAGTTKDETFKQY